MIASLALVIQLSLTSWHGTDEARMNGVTVWNLLLYATFFPIGLKFENILLPNKWKINARSNHHGLSWKIAVLKIVINYLNIKLKCSLFHWKILWKGSFPLQSQISSLQLHWMQNPKTAEAFPDLHKLLSRPNKEAVASVELLWIINNSIHRV